MDIKSAKYVVGPSGVKIIQVTLNGQDNIHLYIPLDPDNTDYQYILEWEKIDGNTIKDAE